MNYPDLSDLRPRDLIYAWAAGFTDGDGCISAVRNKRSDGRAPNIRIRLALTQNDYYTLQHFYNVMEERATLGAIKRQVTHNRQAWVLQYDGPNAINVLKKLQPYLVRKAPEARICIELQELGQMSRHFGPKGIPPEIHAIRERLFTKLRRLK